MNETDLRSELERACAHLRPQADAQDIWTSGMRARQRHRALAVAGVAAAAAAVVAGVTVQAIDSAGLDPRPETTNPTPPDDSVDVRGRIPYLTEDQVQPVFDRDALDSAPWDTASSVRSWDPVDPVPLAENPVEHAGLVVTSDEDEPDAIWVLGDDGQWRSLDMSGLELSAFPGTAQVPSSVSLSPDGTRLALGQTDGAVVVDLTTGERTTYDVPDLGAKNMGRDVVWSADAETLYVDSLARQPAQAIDLATGETGTVPFAPASSAFLADGRVVETHFSGRTGQEIRIYDAHGRLVFRSQGADDVLDDLSDATARGDRLAASRYGTGVWTSADPRGPNAPATGVLIMGSDARPQIFLPVTAADQSETGVVGWRGDDTMLFVVHRERPSAENGWTSTILAWNVESGRITRVADYSSFETMSMAADYLP